MATKGIEEWIEKQADVTDEVARFIFTSKLPIADQAIVQFESLCKDYNDADMAIFINQIREIKSIMAQIKLDGGEP